MPMAIAVTEDIFWVGVNDRKTELFEELWPLPHGISYNAYLIRDEKIALIDTVKKDFFDEFLKQIQPLLEGGRKIDYLVINHIEPDHSGALEPLTRLFPDMCIVGHEKTLELLRDFYHVPNKTQVIREKETLCLGKHTLEFLLTPMIHWPETMLTYEQKTQTLFTGDFLGGFGALPNGIFDDEVDLDFYIEETRRYFSNIIGKCIMDLYSGWSRYQTEKGVVIAYASMYENTKKMAETIARGLTENGIEKVTLFNVSHTHISFIINELWRYQGLIIGSCTYNTRLFPFMELLLSVLENDRIQNHLLGLFGSYSWSGGALSALRDFAQKGAWKLIDPVVEAKCAPSEDVLAQCYALGKNFAQALKAA
jgi:flavorubredoxin